jgi:hypothetical protein
VYGAASPELAATCRILGLPLHVFAWARRMGEVGLAQDALYLVRLDGYVALANAAARPAALRRHVEEARTVNP